MRPVRPPSRRARGASPRSFVGSSLRSDLRRQQIRAGGLELLRRPLSRARPPRGGVCVCRPRAAAAAARARRGAVRARPLGPRIISAPASPVVGGRAPARRAPLCVGSPRAAAAAAARQRRPRPGLFWKASVAWGLPAAAAAARRRAVRCWLKPLAASDFSAVNVPLRVSVLPQELKLRSL